MSCRLLTAAVVAAWCASVVPSAAQTKNRVAIGVAVAAKQATGDEASGTFGPGFIWRFGTAKAGWHVKYGLNWYKAEISRSIAGETLAFGTLKIRPLMAGYGYTHLVGRTAVSANVLGGYAFNAFSPDSRALSALGASLNSPSLVTDIANTFVLKPEVSLWTDVNEKIGVNFNIGYIVSRPFITVTGAGTADRHRVHADALALTVGVVYSVF